MHGTCTTCLCCQAGSPAAPVAHTFSLNDIAVDRARAFASLAVDHKS